MILFLVLLACVFQVAYLKLGVPLAELWPRITGVQFVQRYQEKGKHAALQNNRMLFSLLN